jgi:hypothetical protein
VPQQAAADVTTTTTEFLELQAQIVARKALLTELGMSATARKVDPLLRELLHKQDRFYAAKIQDKIYTRGVNRAHVSVLLHEAVEHLMALGPDRLYIDCTFGRGGHAQLILSKLSQEGRLKAFDIDPMAVQVGQALQSGDCRFQILHAPFGQLADAVDEPVAGVLLDLGVSSPQLDEPSRGFSVSKRKDGPLDLRMVSWAPSRIQRGKTRR